MEILNLNDRPISSPVCLMIGNFDGVHLGHQAIIRRAREAAKKYDCATAVLSFEPHPLKVLAPEKAPQLIQTAGQKRALLADHGIDYYLIQRFDDQLASQSPEVFIAGLKHRVPFKAVLVGFNFRFGRHRSGDTDTLRRLQHPYDFCLIEQQAESRAGLPVSSSRIRDLIRRGRVDEAGDLLGRPYFLEGAVARGASLGRKLKTPTANFAVQNELSPRHGVYASWCRVHGSWYRSISNMGVAPTLGREKPLLETHLFDFEGEIYGDRITVCLTRFLRPERKFDDLHGLKGQIRLDIQKRAAMTDKAPGPYCGR